MNRAHHIPVGIIDCFEKVVKKRKKVEEKMWKVVIRFKSGSKKTLGTFGSYWAADDFARYPENFTGMPFGVVTIEKDR